MTVLPPAGVKPRPRILHIDGTTHQNVLPPPHQALARIATTEFSGVQAGLPAGAAALAYGRLVILAAESNPNGEASRCVAMRPGIATRRGRVHA